MNRQQDVEHCYIWPYLHWQKFVDEVARNATEESLRVFEM